MTTTYSVRKQNVNTYGPITSNYEPTTEKTTIPIISSDVTQSGSETQTSRAPSQHNPERSYKRTTPSTSSSTEHSVYTHKFPRHHFDLTWPFDEEGASSPAPKNQKESASEKKPQRVQNAKFAYAQGSASKTNSTRVPLYADYSSAESQKEPQTQSSSNEEEEEEEDEEEEKPTERAKAAGHRSPFYNFFHTKESDHDTTPKPKQQQQQTKQKPSRKEDEDSHERVIEGSAKKAFYSSGSKEDDKFEDIPNPFADPNFDFNGYLQELRANQAQQRAPNESNQQRRIIYVNPQNAYRPYRPYGVIPVEETTTLVPGTTLLPYGEYQTTYIPDETIKHLETNAALPLVIRNALKNLNGPRGDQPYQSSHTAPKSVETKPLYPGYSPPSYKPTDRGPQTFSNSKIIAYNVNTHKSAFKPGHSGSSQKQSSQKVPVKQVPVVANDDYYYYYYDDEPKQKQQQAKSSSTNNKVVNKPEDDEYYYYEYYDYPEEKNKTKPNVVIRYEYVPGPPPKSSKPVNSNKTPPRSSYSNPNSLPSHTLNTYKSPNDNYYTITPVHVPLTTTPYPVYSSNYKALYTTARTVTTVQPTARQRLTTTTDRDSRHDHPNFYHR